jgi:6,7-dimethyl-8-ribityllumazine synthase
VDGKGKTVAIVYAQWNKAVIDALVGGAVAELERSGANVILQEVCRIRRLLVNAQLVHM